MRGLRPHAATLARVPVHLLLQYFSLVPLNPRELCERGCTRVFVFLQYCSGGIPAPLATANRDKAAPIPARNICAVCCRHCSPRTRSPAVMGSAAHVTNPRCPFLTNPPISFPPPPATPSVTIIIPSTISNAVCKRDISQSALYYRMHSENTRCETIVTRPL